MHALFSDEVFVESLFQGAATAAEAECSDQPEERQDSSQRKVLKIDPRKGRKLLERLSTYSHRELRLAFVHLVEICVDEDDERRIEQRQNCSYHEELRAG